MYITNKIQKIKASIHSFIQTYYLVIYEKFKTLPIDTSFGERLYRFDVAQKCSNPGSGLGFGTVVWTINFT